MFSAVFFTEKRRCFYKIKRKTYQSEALMLDCFFVPKPVKAREKRKLSKALGEGLGKTLFSDEKYAALNFSHYVYNSENFEKRLLAEAFLSFCKANCPESVAVFDDGFLGVEYYKKLSSYTGNLYLPNIDEESTIAEEILKTSGTVIWRKKLANEFSATLNLGKEGKVPTKQIVLFDKGFLKTKTEKLRKLLPKELKALEPISLLGLMFYEFGNKKLCEECVKKVIEL